MPPGTTEPTHSSHTSSPGTEDLHLLLKLEQIGESESISRQIIPQGRFVIILDLGHDAFKKFRAPFFKLFSSFEFRLHLLVLWDWLCRKAGTT